MDWWILKQLRVQVAADLGQYLDRVEFDKVSAQLTISNVMPNHEHFTRELKWGKSATVCGKRLFYDPVAGMTARQLSASEVLMHLGLLTSAQAQHDMLKQIANAAKDKRATGNADEVRDQLAREHIPTFLENLRGALVQYLKHLADLESAPFADLVKESGSSQHSNTGRTKNPIDLKTHKFEVAFSFPGEVRPLVKQIAAELEKKLGSDTYFYDNNYVAQIARPNADLLLQDIYGKRARLVVVFICAEYDVKKWCGVEFRAIRQLLFDRIDRIMLVRAGQGNVEGIFSLDGYVDANSHTPEEIAEQIQIRVHLAEVLPE
ncbi:hypothetical protein RugamoR64_21350 [Duganella rhizosphaerae]|uniref:hypothetical protein n=1 Tax=Duganella rhizosphaerae TaxID=2885763 RepID=UPI0030E79DA4